MSGKPAACVGDPTYCPIVANFSFTVFINGLNASMLASTGTHRNTIITGSSTFACSSPL
ncbi:PAAR domain-containing protein [Ectopseudomonas oleovorans]|uniref:PAAR domain-containing protein n=1 Tax=Ectopseudomonas oleovorans TaxID=301 RepID=UPI000E6AB66F|nr:PAAR domain-containing protein [Pseudomonas oleovorans]